MGGFERLELAEEAVVLRVGDLRRVEDVVGVVGALDLLPQRRSAARAAALDVTARRPPG